MNLQQRVANAAQALIGKTDNSLGTSEANNFLRYGSGNKPLVQNWSDVKMSDEDMYTGYSYAAIIKRANRTSVLGRRFILTEASTKTVDEYKNREEDLIHPYLQVINRSKDFTKKMFWYEISTYLDLEGVYYLGAVRNSRQSRNGVKVGAIQKFVLINPYTVRRVIKESTGEVGGYVESKNGFYREWTPEEIIEIKLLNPFDKDKPYAMTDAAKESQFTLKQAGDYTRQTINGNISAPGIVSTDVLLDDQKFDNFKARINGRQKGEPIFGNGSGAIRWQDMQVDLDKAALDKINEIQRSILFAVTGTGKTVLGIEESGTTRDTSQTQDENFTIDAIIPRVEDICDYLNLDYRKWYDEWEDNQFEIVVDSPVESDRESELKDIEIRDASYDLADKLIQSGYSRDDAFKYANGEITWNEMAEPVVKEVVSEDTGTTTSPEATVEETEPQALPDNLPELDSTNAGLNSYRNAKGGGNPYRDKSGRFASGPGGASIESTNTAASALSSNNKKLEKATSGKTVGALVAKQRESTSNFITENGGDARKFTDIDENWVGNDYKILENHVKKGDSKELLMVHDLQQTYFKQNGIKEVTVYRGVYGKQAKEIKAAIKAGKKVKISGDYASSWTGYNAVAKDYAGGAAFTAPDKISDSVVIKQTFKPQDVVYSTQVAPFYAGNANDEFIISSPKGFSIDASNVEVIQ